jgi:glycosyltransferase involved in cell wall biosynthesis
LAINYLAPVNSLGYGTFGAHLLAALEAGGYAPALFPLGPVEAEERHEAAVQSALLRAEDFDPNAACLKVWHQFDLHTRVGKGVYGAYPFFELDRFTTREKVHLRAVDFLCVSSEWAKGVVLDQTELLPAQVEVCPPGVDTTVFHPDVTPAPIRKPTPLTTVFLNVGKWSLNKGHDTLLEAFNRAFTPADDVLLVAANFNPLQLPGFDGPKESKRWEEMYAASPMGQAGRIKTVPGRLKTQAELAALMAAADVGVFPARAEGWNMPLAEMLAMGKTCIYTHYSAHTEFAGLAGGWPVPVGGTEEAYDGTFFVGQGNWARLDDESVYTCAHLLREAHEKKQAGGLGTNGRGVDAFRDLFTWANCAKRIAETLSLCS